MAANSERTFIMVKPDGVQRGLVGEVLKRFEQRGYKLVGLKLVQVEFRIYLMKSKSNHHSFDFRLHELYSKATMKNTKVRKSSATKNNNLLFFFHLGKKFFEPLLAYIGSGPVVAMVRLFFIILFESIFVFVVA